MADIHDESKVECPLVLIANKDSKPKTTVYRVSWAINGVSKERLYSAKSWADKQRERLQEAATVLDTTIEIFIREIEVNRE